MANNFNFKIDSKTLVNFYISKVTHLMFTIMLILVNVANEI
jgi:hypothetical protein